MRNIITCSALLVLCGLVSISNAGASFPPVAVEASLSGGYSTNLLNDFTQFKHYKPGAHLGLKTHPLANLEISGSYDRNWIRSKLDLTESDTLNQQQRDTVAARRDSLEQILNSLSTVVTSVHTTFIPTGPNARLSLYLDGGIGRRTYDRGNFEIYNTTDYEFTVGTGYQANPTTHLRGELAFTYNDYTDALFLDDMVNSKRGIDLVAGINRSISGSNVIDLELGLSEQRFNRTFVDSVEVIDLTIPSIDTIITDGTNDHTVRSVYVSPRFSRQVGERTGVNLTLTYRSFVSGSDFIVAGEAASLLDPFATVWEGTGLTLSVKTFLIPRVMTTFGLGYWDKTYLRHLEGYKEQPWHVSYSYRPADREDTKRSVFVGLQMPLPKTWGGLMIEPVASIEYGDNSSTIETYDYFGWDLSLGVSVRR